MINTKATCPHCNLSDYYPTGETYLAPQETIDAEVTCNEPECGEKFYIHLEIEISVSKEDPDL